MERKYYIDNLSLLSIYRMILWQCLLLELLT